MINIGGKIVHLTSAHPANDVRIFHKECRSLQNAGYQVTLIAQAAADDTIDQIRIKQIKIRKSRLKRMTFSLFDVYRRALLEEGDLYHFHDPELIPVGLLLKWKGKKVVYDVHEDVPRDLLLKEWLPKLFRKTLSKLVEKIEDYAAKRFDGIVTVTPSIAQRFSNVIEVRNYPKYEEFQDLKINNESNQFLCCYSGLINIQRGFLEMLQLTRTKEHTLFLAGRFADESIRAHLLQDEPKVIYHGLLDQNQLKEFYSKSSVGLALLHPGPTFNTSLPIKLFEYMAAGLPVVISNFPLWREIIERHECGYCVDPKDLEEIDDCINYLKANPVIAKEMGQRGKEAIKNFYNWDLEFPKLSNMYKTILKK